MDVAGEIIGGRFGDVLVRQKKSHDLEVGTLLVCEDDKSYTILSVSDLEYGSQLDDRTRELISGFEMEIAGGEFYEEEFLHYTLARVKPLAEISKSDDKVRIPKTIPPFRTKLRPVTKDDLKFLNEYPGRISIGRIRSGSRVIDAEVRLPEEEIFSHHILIPATTGRGKSNLVKIMLWNLLKSSSVGVLVLDAHDEYARDSEGLRRHPSARRNLAYYTPSSPPPGAYTLSINLRSIRPEHFEGVVNFSEAQANTIQVYRQKRGDDWISALMKDDELSESEKISKISLFTTRRKIKLALGLDLDEAGNVISKNSVFDADNKGVSTTKDIVQHIEEGKIVVLDTSRMGDDAELIIGSIVASELLRRYKGYKETGELYGKPVASIVIEEAPRVLGESLVSKNDNIYSTIAKEGRKFRVGLVAITQMSSVIPGSILANMNTKIILGNEMQQERRAIINSAAQDISDDEKKIASLDKGEAIITSIFVPFAMPIKIPLLGDLVKNTPPEKKTRTEVL